MGIALRSNYLRNPYFDYSFILGLPAIAIISASVVVLNPQLFGLVLILDLWLLGYHHVISTYARLASDWKSFSEHKELLLYLPIGIIAAVAVTIHFFGVWVITTLYLHWQWFHYTRQSEGIAKSLCMKTKSDHGSKAQLNRLVFYLVPISSFLIMSSRGHETFLYAPVWVMPIPAELALLLGYFTLMLFVYWLFVQLKALYKSEIQFTYFAYLVSHHLIYLVAYVLITDITFGWLAINIWHNAQYILFVWHFNSSRHKAGFDKTKPIISYISQPHRWLIYFLSCVLATFIFYQSVGQIVSWLSPYSVLPLAVIAYQTINFHHYVVDSVIWKLRKKSIQANLGIS